MNTISRLNKVSKTENLVLYLIIPTTIALLSFIMLFIKSFSPIVQDVKGVRSSLDGCAPFNISMSSETDTVNLSWETEEKNCYSFIQYGEDKEDIGKMIVEEKSEVNPQRHYVEIDELLPNKTYYFTIVSGDTEYGFNGDLIDIRTKKLPPSY